MRRRGDAGFGMLEVVVAIGIVCVTMAGLTLFLVRTTADAAMQADRQTATQLAVAASERVALLPGAAVLDGRTRSAVEGQWHAPGVDAYLDRTKLAWQEGVVAATAALPTTREPAPIHGAPSRFDRSFYVGVCWQPAAGGDCGVPATTAGLVPMYRVVIAVTWSSDRCAASLCSFVTAMLTSYEVADPTFG